MKKTGFTLTEVLISLTIIGVIAAITVPALIQRTNKQEYVTALQKAYSTLSQAANMIIAENGSPKADENGETWLKDVSSLYNMYKKYLINVKECGSKAGCLPTAVNGYKALGGWNWGGSSQGYIGMPDNNTGYYRRLVTSDGMQYVFSNYYLSSKCNGQVMGSQKVCALIYVDINGHKKPNQVGRDFFLFTLKENGLFPVGCEWNNCAPNNSGEGCACRVLREGKMDY